ncbi:MAG: tetratricopeptide repeat protein [candidate division WOR-3 bacterium]
MIAYILAFLLPLFFLPITADFYDLNKNYLLWLGVLVGFLIWGIKVFKNKKIEIKTSLVTLPLFLLMLAEILSALIASSNKAEAFYLPSGVGTTIALFLLYWLIINSEIKKEKALWSLFFSGAVLALVTIYQFFGLGEVLIPDSSPLAFVKNKAFTPTGNPLVTATFLFSLFPLLIVSLIKEKTNQLRKIVLILGSLLIIGGMGISAWLLLPGKPANLTLLPYSTGWAIAVETFKQKPLFGIGPTDFISAFNQYRPANFNRFNFWNFRFGFSSSYLLQLWTETGLIGLLSFLFMVFALIKLLKQTPKQERFWLTPLWLILALWIFLPGNILLSFLFFFLLALFSPVKNLFSFSLPTKIRWLPLLIIIGIFFPVVWFAGRAYAGEIYFQKSLKALAKNDGLKTYNFQRQAIAFNPRRTDFHLAFSQTNWALAQSISQNPPSGQLTDQDRQNITQLIQQAINEAKIATSLRPNNSACWENLASIYRNLINLAQGADQWAITAYQQAVLTDPINPRLRIDLGGLFYALGNYDEAQKIFRIAVDLKPDHANAWYNLAAAYREDQKYLQAYQAMQQTLSLVPIDSEDWKKAKQELDDLAKKLPSPTPTPLGQPTPTPVKEELKEPQPLPSPAIQPPLELPEENKPEVNPQPTP